MTALLEGFNMKRIAILPNGRIATTSDSGDIELWGPFSGEKIGRLVGHPPQDDDQPEVHGIVALPDGRLASTGDDGSIRLWDVGRRKEIGRLRGHTDGVRSLAMLPDGRLVSGSHDRTIRIWDLARNETDVCLEEVHVAGIEKLLPLPGARLASQDGESSIMMLWDLRTNSFIEMMEAYAGSITVADVLPDGRIVQGCYDNGIRFQDPTTHRLTKPMLGHARPLSALAILTNDRLASAAFDKTVRIWSISERREIACHKIGFVAAGLAQHPDGRLVVFDTNSTLVLMQI